VTLVDTDICRPCNDIVSRQVSVEEHMLSIAGQELHFKSAGKGSPLLLVHTPHRYAKSLLNFLPASASYKVITLDIPGFYNKVTGQAITHVDQFLSIIDALQDSMGYEKVDIMGKCVGALVALKYAADYPHRVGKIIPVAPPLAAYSTRRGTAASGLYAVINVSRLTRKLAKFVNNNALYTHVTRLLGGYGNYTRMIAGELERSSEGYDERVFFGVIHSLLQINIKQLLSSVLTETLIIFGEHDPTVGEARVREAIRIMPNARYACIQGVKHALLERQAEQVNQVVAPFLLGATT